MTALIAQPGDTFVAWMILIACVGVIGRDRIVVALAFIDRRNAETDARVAADFGEPAAVQTDAVADDEWAAILAAVGLTPDDVRRRWIENGGRSA